MKGQNWVIKSVSLTQEHAEMVKKNGIKLSKVLRDALDNIDRHKSGELLEDNASLHKKIERLSETIQGMADFIRKRGLADEFIKLGNR